MPVSAVNLSISSSITLPSAPVRPFQYVIVAFACARARGAIVSVEATAAEPARKARRVTGTLMVRPPDVAACGATLSLAALTRHGAAPQTPRMARIGIDLARRIGVVDRRIFGQFIEHLGRCIYGGIYDEGSPLADIRGFRNDVLDAVRPLRIQILRWPGGNF